MKRRPKNQIKKKLRALKATETTSVTTVDANNGVARSTVYRWKKAKTELEANKDNGNKFYVNSKAHKAQQVRYPILELLDYVSEMRKNRKLCVTTKCLILMMAKFDPNFVRVRQYTALRSWTARFLKRNQLVIRQVTHKGTKTRSDMQDVADLFANSVNVAVEMDGILSYHTSYDGKYSSLFTMDQTAVVIDNPGNLTVDYRGTHNVDIVQGSSEISGVPMRVGYWS
ncbi:hypothetical protein PHMEG_0007420 [Phytophthora megakarya]|uniref:HTH CENPB-type domain-containing protein n=1 Tax=Phytophthora megakarya TaxID=4795 RepID=A0A225WLB4_9STRA|nr:hypothetical protein PHMEG_0007420 [Phytophthora megakarya]